MKILLAFGVDGDFTRYGKRSTLTNVLKDALMDACQTNNEEVVEHILDAGVNPNQLGNNRPNGLRVTKSVRIANMLVKAGASLNATDYFTGTALFHAASTGHLEMAKFLLEAGADVNAGCGDWQGYIYCTPLESAVWSNEVECAELLLFYSKSGQGRAFLRAVELGHLKCVDLFLRSGYDVNSVIETCEEGETNEVTPLMKAAFGGHIACVVYLTDLGADVNARDQKGNTVLMFAAMNCQPGVLAIGPRCECPQ